MISNDRNIKYQTNSVCSIFTLEILKAIQSTQLNDDKKYLIIGIRFLNHSHQHTQAHNLKKHHNQSSFKQSIK